MRIPAACTMGIVSDNALHVMEGAAGLVLFAQKIEARLLPKTTTISLPRNEAETIARLLQDAAVVIDNLLLVVEQRDLALASGATSMAQRSRERLRGRKQKIRKKR